jgi:trehalose synthase
MSLAEAAEGPPSLLDGYRRVAGDRALIPLERLAHRLREHRLVMVSASATGGAADVLRRLVRLLNELGLSTTWEVMPDDPEFGRIVRTLGRALQGRPVELTSADHDYFHEATRRAAQALTLDGDLVMIHDAPPVALAAHRRRPHQHWVWRCHVDPAHADPAVWDFLAPSVAHYHAAVFSHVAFVPPLPLPAYLVLPSIDPLSDRNRELPADQEEALLAPLGLPSRKPWVLQVGRFDRLEDPLGVIEAFELVRKRESAHLVLAGARPDDDPEGLELLGEVRERVARRGDISLVTLPPDSHLLVNALQRRAQVVVQKPLRGGFSHGIAEALWKRRAVVASAVGGVPLQVLHERTGLLVRSIEGCAYQITRLLRAPELRRRLGRGGREHVRDNFLHPRQACDLLALFAMRVERRGD